MTPHEIAAVLGWDRTDVIRAVPFDDRPFVDPGTTAEAMPRRLRKVV